MGNKKNSIGKRIEIVRRMRGWSRQVLADKSGVTLAYLGKVEGGKSNVSSEVLSKIADVFDVELNYFDHRKDIRYIYQQELKKICDGLKKRSTAQQEFPVKLNLSTNTNELIKRIMLLKVEEQLEFFASLYNLAERLTKLDALGLQD